MDDSENPAASPKNHAFCGKSASIVWKVTQAIRSRRWLTPTAIATIFSNDTPTLSTKYWRDADLRWYFVGSCFRTLTTLRCSILNRPRWTASPTTRHRRGFRLGAEKATAAWRRQ